MASEVVERYSYDDYGMPTVWVKDGQDTWIEHTDASGAPVSSIGNPFMFTGRRWDPELGLYDYRTRYYNPELGRFLRVDTIGPWGDPANLGNPYTYLGNNPWSGTDPWGQGPLDWLKWMVNYEDVEKRYNQDNTPSFQGTIDWSAHYASYADPDADMGGTNPGIARAQGAVIGLRAATLPLLVTAAQIAGEEIVFL